jgi:hypothetical protein
VEPEPCFRKKFREIDQEIMDEVVADEYVHVREASRTALSAWSSVQLVTVGIHDELSCPLGFGTTSVSDNDFHVLINMHRKHQTKQAASGVCTKQVSRTADVTADIRCSIIEEFHAILKEGQTDEWEMLALNARYGGQASH